MRVKLEPLPATQCSVKIDNRAGFNQMCEVLEKGTKIWSQYNALIVSAEHHFASGQVQANVVRVFAHEGHQWVMPSTATVAQ